MNGWSFWADRVAGAGGVGKSLSPLSRRRRRCADAPRACAGALGSLRQDRRGDRAVGSSDPEPARKSAGRPGPGTDHGQRLRGGDRGALSGWRHGGGGAAFIERLWEPMFADPGADTRDAKTLLQEWAQARGRGAPVYTLRTQTGPDHAPIFVVEARVAGGRAHDRGRRLQAPGPNRMRRPKLLAVIAQ